MVYGSSYAFQSSLISQHQAQTCSNTGIWNSVRAALKPFSKVGGWVWQPAHTHFTITDLQTTLCVVHLLRWTRWTHLSLYGGARGRVVESLRARLQIDSRQRRREGERFFLLTCLYSFNHFFLVWREGFYSTVNTGSKPMDKIPSQTTAISLN